ncbi:hypothetical protein JR316_0006200 [Psilocybe cubensis]|uniref:Uncharacterized protein n=2 Tax=Psilocybe cubensis TaxID=181762 RepID=A0ACB8H183_PSICU|nr:hypothetical protein JR316_0006200 [Psilocybe cubensis]KAH9481673.1 hypothetical protein JR316_0006200 [Psilocybe cubensis]
MSNSTFTPIPSSQIGGAIAVNVFAVLSTIALVSVILRVFWLAIRRQNSPIECHECVFFNTQLGQYAACLIIGMVFDAIAGVIGLSWVMEQGITEGWMCRMQATLMQIGNFSTGYFTIAIAVHTFNCLVLKMRQSVLVCRTAITVGWVFSLLVAVGPFFVHPEEGYVYGAAGLMCGVRAIFPKALFIFHILPILLASILGAILYSLIFLVLRGTLKFNSGIKITLNPNKRWNNKEGLGENYHRFVARIARSMLWYPVAYVAFLIPYAVTRLFMLSGFVVPYEAVVFASICWFTLSFVDVLLLYNTFRVLGPAFEARSAASSRKSQSLSSSSNLEKYGVSPSPFERAALEEKIHHYRTQSENSTAPSTLSSGSARPLLPLYLNHEDYRGSAQAATIGRNISPSFGRDSDIATPPPIVVSPSRSSSRDVATHVRNDSFTSRGLPAPPRKPVPAYNASKAIPLIPSSPESPTSVYSHDTRWLSRQQSTQTFGQRNSAALTSPSVFSDGGFSEWSTVTPPQGYGQPMLSAVGNGAFLSAQGYDQPSASATIERSISVQATSQVRGQRPLLLSRGSSPDLREAISRKS